MAVTAHYADANSCYIRARILDCVRFKGSHTGEEIAEKLKLVMAEYSAATKDQSRGINYRQWYKRCERGEAGG